MWSERVHNFAKTYNVCDCKYSVNYGEEPMIYMTIGAENLLRIIDDLENAPKSYRCGFMLENFTKEELEELNIKITKLLDDLNYKNIIGF